MPLTDIFDVGGQRQRIAIARAILKVMKTIIK